jgi:hypothetical protein
MNLDIIREKPRQVSAVLAVILFWMLTPLVAQKYYGISAIEVSFGITVFYFILWKLYNNREKVEDFFNR